MPEIEKRNLTAKRHNGICINCREMAIVIDVHWIWGNALAIALLQPHCTIERASLLTPHLHRHRQCRCVCASAEHPYWIEEIRGSDRGTRLLMYSFFFFFLLYAFFCMSQHELCVCAFFLKRWLEHRNVKKRDSLKSLPTIASNWFRKSGGGRRKGRGFASQCTTECVIICVRKEIREVWK